MHRWAIRLSSAWRIGASWSSALRSPVLQACNSPVTSAACPASNCSILTNIAGSLLCRRAVGAPITTLGGRNGGQPYEKYFKNFCPLFQPVWAITRDAAFRKTSGICQSQEKKTMFNKKSLFVPAALILASFLGVSAANAQSSACPYTIASLKGTYAVIGNYGSNVAIALATRSLDGNGNLSGTSVINEPTPGSTTGARTITDRKSTRLNSS